MNFTVENQCTFRYIALCGEVTSLTNLVNSLEFEVINNEDTWIKILSESNGSAISHAE